MNDVRLSKVVARAGLSSPEWKEAFNKAYNAKHPLPERPVETAAPVEVKKEKDISGYIHASAETRAAYQKGGVKALAQIFESSGYKNDAKRILE